jgi:hypothetical protein
MMLQQLHGSFGSRCALQIVLALAGLGSGACSSSGGATSDVREDAGGLDDAGVTEDAALPGDDGVTWTTESEDWAPARPDHLAMTGTWLVYSLEQDDLTAVKVGADQVSQPVRLADDDPRSIAFEAAFSPDGRYLAYREGTPGAAVRLMLRELGEQGFGDATVLATEQYGYHPAFWSPDGRWLAHPRCASGCGPEMTRQEELVLTPVGDASGREEIVLASDPFGVEFGHFSPDSQYFLFHRNDQDADGHVYWYVDLGQPGSVPVELGVPVRSELFAFTHGEPSRALTAVDVETRSVFALTAPGAESRSVEVEGSLQWTYASLSAGDDYLLYPTLRNRFTLELVDLSAATPRPIAVTSAAGTPLGPLGWVGETSFLGFVETADGTVIERFDAREPAGGERVWPAPESPLRVRPYEMSSEARSPDGAWHAVRIADGGQLALLLLNGTKPTEHMVVSRDVPGNLWGGQVGFAPDSSRAHVVVQREQGGASTYHAAVVTLSGPDAGKGIITAAELNTDAIRRFDGDARHLSFTDAADTLRLLDVASGRSLALGRSGGDWPTFQP